ncbi:hypothetical protein HQ524_01660 [Candidatus Uhrbacteria bacterium]|nr:hypothetical protein [Candidatus Uhrbacteria bacterium]
MRVYDYQRDEEFESFKSCIDGVHASWQYCDSEDGEASFEIDGPCDGSCAPTMVALNGYSSGTTEAIEMGDGSMMPNRLIVDAAVMALFDQGDVVGELMYDKYIKRESSTQVLRLGDGRCIVVRTDFDHMACRDTGFFETCQVSLSDAEYSLWEFPATQEDLLRLWHSTPDHSEG